jgi:hypothetical protein
MRNKRIIALVGIFCLLNLSSFSLDQDEGSEQESERGTRRLIRRDLLQKEREEPKLPGRNIFTPRNRGIKEEAFPSFDMSSGEEASLEAKESSYSFSLRYIGYIDSGQKMVALIIFEGEAIAVEEGEKISQEHTVGEITTERIEIIGPSGGKKQIPLEGDS